MKILCRQNYQFVGFIDLNQLIMVGFRTLIYDFASFWYYLLT